MCIRDRYYHSSVLAVGAFWVGALAVSAMEAGVGAAASDGDDEGGARETSRRRRRTPSGDERRPTPPRRSNSVPESLQRVAAAAAAAAAADDDDDDAPQTHVSSSERLHLLTNSAFSDIDGISTAVRR